MARQQIQPEQWAQSKALWESDDKISYADIGTSLGISKQAVAKRAKAEKWQKRMDLPKIVNRAHEMADRAMAKQELPLATSAPQGGNSPPPVDAAPPKKGVPPELPPMQTIPFERADTAGMTLEQRAEAMAIEKRAEIMTRHRTELAAIRRLVYAGVQTVDRFEAFERGKVAKIHCEAITILQAAERKAWGMDKVEAEQAQVVIIDRG